MKVIQKTLMVEPNQEKDYLAVPFDVDESIAQIDVHYRYDTGSCIDLAVAYQDEIRGWSGGERATFYINNAHATPGYQAGVLPGRWEVVIGTYSVPRTTRVSIAIKLTPKQPKWLKGDFHSHTINSDGHYSIPQAVSSAKAQGLDFLATTDHHSVAQNYAYPQEESLVLIPGMELTSYKGHAGFLGVKKPVKDFRVLTSEQVKALFAEGKANGATVGLNHPFVHCAWGWGFDVDYDYVEIWNGPWGTRNRLAIEWWHQQLCEGKRIAAIGGSDFHRPDNPHPHVNATPNHGCPTTYIYSEEKSVDAILQGVREGRSCISDSPSAPFIEQKLAEIDVTGQGVDKHSNITIQVTQLQLDDRVWVITDQVEELLPHLGDELISTFQLDGKFMRVEVRGTRYSTEQERIVALSNPVYSTN